MSGSSCWQGLDFADGVTLWYRTRLPTDVLFGAGAGSMRQALGISRRKRLYLGDQLLAEGCTSATLRMDDAGGPYLLFITSDNVLHTVPLSCLQDGLPLTADISVPERSDPRLWHATSLTSLRQAVAHPDAQSGIRLCRIISLSYGHFQITGPFRMPQCIEREQQGGVLAFHEPNTVQAKSWEGNGLREALWGHACSYARAGHNVHEWEGRQHASRGGR